MASLSRASRIRTNNINPSICDIQEKFRAQIYEFPKLYDSLQTRKKPKEPNNLNITSVSITDKMLQAASILKMPVFVTTQSRKKLGNTVSELQERLNGPHIRADVDKTIFSMITPEIEKLLPAASETQLDVIIVGLETHICVTQTTLDLLERGHRVYVLVDGVSSVNSEERGVALARLRDAGAVITSSEGVLFEIVGDAGHEAFRAISGLVKETKESTKGALGVFSKI
uniref:uncharacterized protein n=1 Tax=Penicillium paradoxum TaxID=176176 RepID=UPI00254730C1|nr:uncharacterized protein N7457_002982 [Penicillium paradoxum]KAJ5787992.1 hypothetical protein N7457_002982 [Penicillium paradoxum]